MATQLETLRDLPAETADGVRIELLGNIEFPHEVAHCVERGADGIGLYRTEFLYLGADCEPDEEVHYEAYAKVIGRNRASRPVMLRTCDLGADKVTRRRRGRAATPPWACAASGCRLKICRCSARSCGPCCGPARWATCG